VGARRLTQRSAPFAIRIQGLGKYFGAPLDVAGSEPADALRALRRLLGFRSNATAGNDVQRTVTIAGHVLREISLDIEQGSVVCLAGASGSGKSVLLKILAGVMPPTSGRIELHGTVNSLLSVGGMDSGLTAYEHIDSYRRLFRLPAAGAAGYSDDVIAFAELEGFADMPVRTYSTGMMLRLSVALALSGTPSIVLIDDVLGVGDMAFRQKCVERLHALKGSGCTLVVAFSDEELIDQLATRVITLGGGRIADDSPPRRWLVDRHSRSAAQVQWRISPNLPEDDVMAISSIAVDERPEGDETCLCISLTFVAKAGSLRCRPSIFLMRGTMVVFRSLHPYSFAMEQADRVLVTVKVPTQWLSDGDYTVTTGVLTERGRVHYSLKAPEALALRIRRDAVVADQAASTPVLTTTFPWEIEPVVLSRA
jgi:ABC-type polysaccharide/polyol phosphate transport system ATPase subunit